MPRVVVTLEQRFERTPDGRVWSPGPFAYSFWERYLSVFSEVCVVARIREVSVASSTAIEATGPAVNFVGLPPYRGATAFVLNALAIRSTALATIQPGDAVILRVPSGVASLVVPALRRRRIPYALEVGGDPQGVFGPGAVRHPFRPLIRWKMTRDLKLQARYAVGAAYVTRSTLQQLYPCGAAQTDYSDVQLPIDDNPAIRAFATHYSTVELGTGAFVVQRPRPLQAASVRLITVGTFEQLYKGPDILIDAVALCISFGLDICVRFVGTGKHLEEMRRRAIARQLGNRVEFTGQVECRRTLIELLDSSDIFVLPSRTEGLPRAMIEAMARGLPCVGTSVGGIPELLDDEDLVPPNDATALARKIDEVLTLPERLARMSRKNLDRAREYAPDRLASRRNEFYRHVGRAARILSPNPNMVPRTPAV